MTCENRGNWIRHFGGELPAAWDHRGQHGPAAGQPNNGRGQPRGAAPEPRVSAEGAALTPPQKHRYRSLLVPVDGSPFGEHALPLALGIARRAGARVRLVHVHSAPESALERGLRYAEGDLDERRRAYLDGLVRRIAKVSPVSVTPVLLQGRGVAEALGTAAGAGTDLVVMASRRHGPLTRLWGGGVADALLHRLSAPLLLVRGYNAPADLSGDPAVRHVLLPLDGSPSAERVAWPALALGDLTGARSTLLRVLPLSVDYSVGYGDGAAQRLIGVGRQSEAWNYLRRVTERLGRRTPRVRTRVVLDEEPTARAILRYAQNHEADLIALTVRGRGRLARLFRGGVVDKVIREAAVPVLVYPPDGGPGG